MRVPSPMICLIDLDWCTYVCPCGQELCTRFLTRGDVITFWLHEHKSHTNGKIREHTTPDGERAWGKPIPDEIVDYPNV